MRLFPICFKPSFTLLIQLIAQSRNLLRVAVTILLFVEKNLSTSALPRPIDRTVFIKVIKRWYLSLSAEPRAPSTDRFALRDPAAVAP